MEEYQFAERGEYDLSVDSHRSPSCSFVLQPNGDHDLSYESTYAYLREEQASLQARYRNGARGYNDTDGVKFLDMGGAIRDGDLRNYRSPNAP